MRKGFTLAEVLITLGIVGIVAVLTIPSVMKNYKNRLYTSQLEKVYAQISDATQAIMNDEHVDSFYETKANGTEKCTDNTKQTCTGGLPYFLSNYFETVKKNCASGDADELCVAGSTTSSYKYIDGSNAGGIGSGTYCVQLASGATICGFHNPANKCTSLAVDVNGQAAPNIAGRDLFSMDIHKDGSLSDYGSGCADNAFGCTADRCNAGGGGSVYESACGCVTAVIEAGWKMEY